MVKKHKTKTFTGNLTGWSFGLVNNKLAEIFFEKRGDNVKYLGHCFVRNGEYKTKQELNWIGKDTKNVQLRYRDGHYQKIPPRQL